MKSIIYLVLILFALISCTKKDSCPPDQRLGSLSLNANSREFLPYSGILYLKFANGRFYNDTALLFNPSGLISDSSRTIVANFCLEDIYRADSFYASEHKTVNFFDLDTSRKFRVIGNLDVVEDFLSKSSTSISPVLYDELKLTVHRNNPSKSGAVATIEFVTNDRGNKNRMSDSLISRIGRYLLLPSITINDSVYTDVYEVRTNDSIYYYFKPLSGVVAFRDLDNHWWNLISAY